MAQVKELLVPDLGNYTDVPIVDILVTAGDKVEKDEALLTIESEKAVMDIPSEYSGTIKEIKLKVEDKVSAGDLIGTIEVMEIIEESRKNIKKSEEVSPGLLPPAQENLSSPVDDPASSTVAAEKEQAISSVKVGDLIHASPAVRLNARELGADISKISGTGPNQRITKDDVKKYIKNILSSEAGQTTKSALTVSSEFFAPFGSVEVRELSRIQRISSRKMTESWQSIPHVTNFDEADITELESFRKQLNKECENNPKFTILPFFLKVFVSVLKNHPKLNASVGTGNTIIYKNFYNIGCAMDTPEGLVVPVIKKADTKSVRELAGEIIILQNKALENKLTMDDLTGSTISVSSLGSISVTGFTPIIKHPDAAVIGISKAQWKPVYEKEDNNFIPRFILPFSVSYDHRIIDGAVAARFTRELALALSDIRRILL